MNRNLSISLIAFVGLAIAVAAYYIAIGFGSEDQPKTAEKDSKREQKKLASNLKVAREACKIAPPKVVALAPKGVSGLLMSLPNCPAPLFVDSASQSISETDKEKGRTLRRYVEYQADISFTDTRAFVDDLRRYGVRVIIMSQEGIRNKRVKDILRQMGYDKVKAIENNHIWIQNVSWREVDERDRREAQGVCRHVPKGSYVLAPLGVSVHLEKIGCCRSFIYNLPDAFANPGFERRRELLEDVLSVDKDFLTVEATILR